MVRVFLGLIRLMALMAGVNTDPSTGADRWAAGLSGAGAKVTAGVDAVTSAPGAKAAAAADKWLANIQQAREKFARRVGGVSLGEWQDAMKTRGIPAMATAAGTKKDKYTAAAQDLYPFIAEQSRRVQGMPKATIQDSINRVTAFITGMAGYKRR